MSRIPVSPKVLFLLMVAAIASAPRLAKKFRPAAKSVGETLKRAGERLIHEAETCECGSDCTCGDTCICGTNCTCEHCNGIREPIKAEAPPKAEPPPKVTKAKPSAKPKPPIAKKKPRNPEPA